MSRFPSFFRQSQQLWTPQLYRQHHSNFSTLPDSTFLHTVCHLYYSTCRRSVRPRGSRQQVQRTTRSHGPNSTAAHCYTFLGFRCSSSCIHDDILQKQIIRYVVLLLLLSLLSRRVWQYRKYHGHGGGVSGGFIIFHSSGKFALNFHPWK